MGPTRRHTTSTSRFPVEDASISHLQTSDTRAFTQLVALYRESFPPEERKPVATLSHMLVHPAYRFWIAQRDQQLLAFAIVHASSTHSIALLEYMAVDPATQGRGLGRRLLTHVINTLRDSHRPLLIEVESDQLASPHRSLRSRRKQFYRSFGAREITGLDYRMPQVATGTPPPMNLLVVSHEPRPTLANPTLHAWLTSLYVEVYRQSPADPRLVTMLASLPEEIPLR